MKKERNTRPKHNAINVAENLMNLPTNICSPQKTEGHIYNIYSAYKGHI
jgi:hypothetical protein